jgi:hypothetical protein
MTLISPSNDDAAADETPESPGEYPMGAEIIDDGEIKARDEAARRLEMAVARLEEATNPSRVREQVPLSFLLQLFVGASILLALSRSMPQGVFAGACGVVGLGWLIINTAFSIRSVRVEWAWWTLMATYLVATLFAIVSR